MSKLIYKHGVMGSGKSFDLIRTVYNYRERGLTALVLKPVIDTAEGTSECVIKTRVGLELNAEWLDGLDSLDCYLNREAYDVVIVDESQFLSKEEVEVLSDFCYQTNTPVILYGLKNTFQGKLFDGSKRIIELADKIEEFKAMCPCGRTAKQNARVIDGKVISEGSIVGIKNEVEYVSYCTNCFRKLGGI